MRIRGVRSRTTRVFIVDVVASCSRRQHLKTTSGRLSSPLPLDMPSVQTSSMAAAVSARYKATGLLQLALALALLGLATAQRVSDDPQADT